MMRMVKSVVSDFDEAFWQDVLKEAMNEIEDSESHLPRFAGVGVAIAERDSGLVQRGFRIEMEDGGVGESDAVDVAGEVSDGIFAGADIGDMNDPVGGPDIWRYRGEDLRYCFAQSVPETGSE